MHRQTAEEHKRRDDDKAATYPEGAREKAGGKAHKQEHQDPGVVRLARLLSNRDLPRTLQHAKCDAEHQQRESADEYGFGDPGCEPSAWWRADHASH